MVDNFRIYKNERKSFLEPVGGQFGKSLLVLPFGFEVAVHRIVVEPKADEVFRNRNFTLFYSFLQKRTVVGIFQIFSTVFRHGP